MLTLCGALLLVAGRVQTATAETYFPQDDTATTGRGIGVWPWGPGGSRSSSRPVERVAEAGSLTSPRQSRASRPESAVIPPPLEVPHHTAGKSTEPPVPSLFDRRPLLNRSQVSGRGTLLPALPPPSPSQFDEPTGDDSAATFAPPPSRPVTSPPLQSPRSAPLAQRGSARDLLDDLDEIERLRELEREAREALEAEEAGENDTNDDDTEAGEGNDGDGDLIDAGDSELKYELKLKPISLIVPSDRYDPDYAAGETDDPCRYLCPRPDDCPPLEKDELARNACPPDIPLPDAGAIGRNWDPKRYHWVASDLTYNPLYFEDPQLERYGQTYPFLVQPFVSTGRFLGQATLWPYLAAVDPPHSCVTPLGYYRPGECAPKLHPALGFDAVSAFEAAIFYAGTIVVLP